MVKRIAQLSPVLLVALVMACSAGAVQERGAAEKDKQVFTDQGCYGCHTAEKFETPIGPDLSHVGAQHNAAYLTRWLRDPASPKPTAHMPKIEFSEAELTSLTAYLASLR